MADFAIDMKRTLGMSAEEREVTCASSLGSSNGTTSRELEGVDLTRGKNHTQIRFLCSHCLSIRAVVGERAATGQAHDPAIRRFPSRFSHGNLPCRSRAGLLLRPPHASEHRNQLCD
jgi:hypothetical protein